jgi:hypothetical protein
MNKSDFAKLALAGLVSSGLGFTACNKGTESKTEPILNAGNLAAFQAECEKLGGMFAPHSCETMNTCAGYSYQNNVGANKHDCTGKSKCEGGSCKIEG